jgi:hypothetical protein
MGRPTGLPQGGDHGEPPLEGRPTRRGPGEGVVFMRLRPMSDGKTGADMACLSSSPLQSPARSVQVLERFIDALIFTTLRDAPTRHTKEAFSPSAMQLVSDLKREGSRVFWGERMFLGHQRRGRAHVMQRVPDECGSANIFQTSSCGSSWSGAGRKTAIIITLPLTLSRSPSNTASKTREGADLASSQRAPFPSPVYAKRTG